MVHLLFFYYYVNNNSHSKVKLHLIMCKTGISSDTGFFYYFSSVARIAAPMAPAYLASGVLSTGAFNASAKRSRT